LNIYLINKSTAISDAEVESWVTPFNRFITNVRSWWPRPATLLYVDKADEPALAWKVIIADTSDQAGALGYHDFTPDGRPISYVFAADDLKYGYSPTVTATHEIAEMIADPWISQLFQISSKAFFAQEICDPCEADEFAYTIDGIKMSDFVLPKWFIPGSTGQFDYMKHISKPLQLLSGGYMSVFVSGKGWTQIYAQANGKLVNVKDKGEKGKFSRLLKYGRKRESLPEQGYTEIAAAIERD
jgi:hypothetical protein